MDLLESNLANLQRRYRENDPKLLASRALLNRVPRGAAEINLEWLLRHHREWHIVSTFEIDFRDGVDKLMHFYSLLEIGCLAGLLPERLPEPLSLEARAQLGNWHVRRYYESHYPLLLPALFRQRVSGWGLPAYTGEPKAFAAFATFLDLTDRLEDPDAATFLDLLDDIEWHGKGIDDLVEVLESPESTIRHLSGEGDQVLVSAMCGLRHFMVFCDRLGHLLRATDAWSPLVASGFWHHHAYWLSLLADKLAASFNTLLAPLRRWPDADETGIASFAESLGFLLSPSHGFPLEEASKLLSAEQAQPLHPTIHRFREDGRLREPITASSDYVSHPLEPLVDKGSGADEKSEHERMNRANALWQRPMGEITEDQYNEFYRSLAHTPESETPVARAHFKVEGTQEFAGLVYVPREKPFEFRTGIKHRGVRLYVKHVLVMEDCEELVPDWLRFVVGVIDSDDLPLNVSRKVLQQSSGLRTIKMQLVKHVLDALDALAADKPDDYAVAWKTFGPFLKQGIVSDYEYKERLAKLLRYESTNGEGTVALTDYVKRMKVGQDAVYYAIGESREALEAAPHLEGLRKRGYEVLLMTDPIDEWAVESLRAFEGKNIVSAMHADLEIEATEAEKSERKAEEEALAPLFAKVRAVLGERITEVRVSDRLTDSPACLVPAGTSPHEYVERLLRKAGHEVPKSSRILELNSKHPIVKSLESLAEKDDDGKLADWIEVLYDQALVAEGAPISDPAGFARLIAALLASASTPTESS